MSAIKKITVFCGSNYGKNKIYESEIRKLADLFVQKDITLVYGGSQVGLMNAVSDQIIKQDGKVVGVTTEQLKELEVHHKTLSDLRVTDSMHERKKMMSDLADAFILCPGGCGSLDEFFEIYTWTQLGIHEKPIGILNTDNYYKDLIKLLDFMVDEQFVKSQNRNMLCIDDDPERLLEKLEKYQYPKVDKWFANSRKK